MIGKSTVQRMVGTVTPPLHRLGFSRLFDNAAAAFAFLGGQGAGAGWDQGNEVATAATFVSGPAPVILDVGANKGEWTALMRSAPGTAQARYFLFEVAPYCFEALDRLLAIAPEATLVKQAVSEESGSATFSLPRVFSGLGSLHARKDVGVRQLDYDSVTVPTIRLDDFAEAQGIESIALMKLDIEGHELFALRGATKLLESGRIRALTFEFGSANINSRTFFRDFWDLLTGFGYSIHRMVPGGGTIAVPRYSERLEYFRGATNYVARLDR